MKSTNNISSSIQCPLQKPSWTKKINKSRNCNWKRQFCILLKKKKHAIVVLTTIVSAFACASDKENSWDLSC